MEIERLGAAEGFTTPMLLRHTTSSVVYNCKSLANAWEDGVCAAESPHSYERSLLSCSGVSGMVQHGSLG